MSATADRRRAVYDFIVAYKRAHDGNSPSIRDIMRGCGYATTSAVGFHLNALERAGLIRMRRFTGRTIEIVGGAWQPPSP